jgi:two-component system, response regulator YesN
MEDRHMKVVLVDDERIVIEHLKSLIYWEQLGYVIAASATNGKSALRLCEELRPGIMIIDIRMPVMDGLQLIRAVNEQGLGTKFIVMSAYEDFEYARQAISSGNVVSYLVKHEVDRQKLITELNKARAAWETEEKQRRSARNELLKQCVLGANSESEQRLGKILHGSKQPYGLLIVQPDVPFTAALQDTDETVRGQRSVALTPDEFKQVCEAAAADWQLLGEFSMDGGQIAAVFALEAADHASPAALEPAFRNLLVKLQSDAGRRGLEPLSMFYLLLTGEPAEHIAAFRRIAAAARHSVFCGREAIVNISSLPLPAKSAASDIRKKEGGSYASAALQDLQYDIVSSVNEWFDSVIQPVWDLKGLYEIIGRLSNLIYEKQRKKGQLPLSPLDIREYGPVYHVDEIRLRFVRLLSELYADGGESNCLSSKLLKATQYIQENYHEEISIEDVSYTTGISPSYLHLLFKKELDRTFLDYVTEIRIAQAKRILRKEDAKIADIAARVGYRSPQHFSQVFKKVAGMLPHQYRDGDGGSAS